MRLADLSRIVLGLAETAHRWLAALATLEEGHRAKVARYAEEIAATLARAAEALVRLETEPADAAARRALAREFGRIRGYVETMVAALEHHLDGRKLAGVKRRLEHLEADPADGPAAPRVLKLQIDRLLAAEGYFRALADGLRT
jgi:hypothetical protein